jgi:hypothetical protein
MKVLIDRNIERLSVTHVTQLVPQKVKWGPQTYQFDVAQRVYRPRREDETFLREQLPYLASLCNSAKEGTTEFYTSFELRIEAIRQKGPQDGYLGINLLRGIQIQTVPPPIQRSFVIGGARQFDAEECEQEQMNFFRSIQHPRFLQLRKAVGEAQIDDAFHLWTAEEASLDVFLTLDKNFLNNLQNRSKRINSTVLVTAPKDLCEKIGLPPLDIEAIAAEINPFS